MTKKWKRLAECSTRICLFGTFFSLVLCSHVSADVLSDFNQALTEGTPSLELRLAYEYSDLDDPPPTDHDPANSLTLRTRLGYRSGDFLHTNAFLQFHDMANPIDKYRWKDGGNDGYDVVADPDGTRVQQVYLDINLPAKTTLRPGRQEIILDDARLIGNIGWRQNGQAFEAVSLKSQAISDLTLYGSYIDRVNTILLTNKNLDGLILLNAKYSGLADQNIAAFCYLLETENKTPAARDSATYGLRLNGNLAAFNYDLTYAHQSDFEDGENHNGDMVNAFIGAKFEPFGIGAGYNYISGQDGDDRPFDTLFSTAHKFNGWADTFLATNGGKLAGGLSDYYVQAETKWMGTTFKAVYHYFDTTEEINGFDDDYGDEFDFLIVKKISKNLKVLTKYAFYEEKNNSASKELGLGGGGFDKQVLWLRLIATF